MLIGFMVRFVVDGGEAMRMGAWQESFNGDIERVYFGACKRCEDRVVCCSRCITVGRYDINHMVSSCMVQ